MLDGSNMPAADHPRTFGARKMAVTYMTCRVWNERAFAYVDVSGPVGMTTDEAWAADDGYLTIVRGVRSF